MSHLWLRLLWKEYRESRLVLLASVVLPAVLLAWRVWRNAPFDLVPYIVMPLLVLLMVAWTVQRVQASGEGQAVRLALPLSPVQRGVMLYLLPLPVLAVVGVMLSLLLWTREGGPLSVSGQSLLFALLFQLTLFLLCTTLTRVYGVIPAMLTGMILLFFTLDLNALEELWPVFLATAVAAIVAGLLWNLFVYRQRLVLGRVVVALLLAGSISVVPLGLVLADMTWHGEHGELIAAQQPEIPDTSAWAELPDHTALASQNTWSAMALYDRHTGQNYEHACAMPSRILCLLDRHRVLIMQQATGSRQAQLAVWDVKTGADTPVCRCAPGMHALGRVTESMARTDGQYVLFFMMSKFSGGRDLWVVDLTCKTAHVVAAGLNQDAHAEMMHGVSSLAWMPHDRAVITLGREVVDIDLPAAKRIPEAQVLTGRIP